MPLARCNCRARDARDPTGGLRRARTLRANRLCLDTRRDSTVIHGDDEVAVSALVGVGDEVTDSSMKTATSNDSAGGAVGLRTLNLVSAAAWSVGNVRAERLDRCRHAGDTLRPLEALR